MTQETDSIIAYFKACGIDGKVTDLNTPKVHSPGSFHYYTGTPTPKFSPPDCCFGRIGLAVDFAFTPRQVDTEPLAAIFKAFEPVEHLLTELFHSGPSVDHYVRRGKRYPIRQLEAAVRKIHHDHVHVAVAKGTFLPLPLPTLKKASTMIKGTAVKILPTPAGYYIVASDGGVFAYGDAKFYGSAADLKLQQPITDAALTTTGNGYFLLGGDAGVFAYGDAKFIDAPNHK